MTRKTIRTGGHTIEIAWSIWTGKERISVDARVVSEKRSYHQIAVLSPGGGTARRRGLKNPWGKPREGSTPSPGNQPTVQVRS